MGGNLVGFSPCAPLVVSLYSRIVIFIEYCWDFRRVEQAGCRGRPGALPDPLAEELLELALEPVEEETEDIPDREEDPEDIEYMEAELGTDRFPIEYWEAEAGTQWFSFHDFDQDLPETE